MSKAEILAELPKLRFEDRCMKFLSAFAKFKSLTWSMAQPRPRKKTCSIVSWKNTAAIPEADSLWNEARGPYPQAIPSVN